MSQRPVVIVGAGPAGMAAALALAQAGIRPLVIDENPRPGGQIYRQPHTALAPHQSVRPLIPLLRAFGEKRNDVDLSLDTVAWGLFPGRRLAVTHAGRSQFIEARNLILAPGAYEYLPPFPGWTLPGVMTPGAAQALVKGSRVLPGKRALVAGTGPFLLVVAHQLHWAGVEVVGVVEMATTRETVRALPRLLWQPSLLWEGARYFARLRRAGIPIHRGHVLIEARGDGEVQEAVFAACDREGHPDQQRPHSIDVDTICAGYGFVPRIQLAQLAGCRLRFNESLGGWLPEVDANLQTSVPGIWVAGDGGGVAGAVVAGYEGTLAGLAVARQLGAVSQIQFEREVRPVRRKLARMARFRAALDRLYRLRPALTELADAETIVCRCEELTRSEVEEGVAAGGSDIRTIKVMTRLGMGPCQGQICWPAAARMIAARIGQSTEALGPLSARPPISPVTLGELVEEEPVPVACTTDFAQTSSTTASPL